LRNRLGPLSPLWVLMPVGFLFLASFIRLLQLHLSGLERAEGRFVKTQVLEAPRGRILDRSRRVLAEDRPTWKLVMDAPWEGRRHGGRWKGAEQEKVEDLQDLASACGLEAEALAAIMADPNRVRVALARDLSTASADRVRAILSVVPGSGLKLEKGWKRFYPHGRVLSHLVGYTSVVGEVRRGAIGLEQRLNSDLAGVDGKKESLEVFGSYGVNPAGAFRPAKSAPDWATTLDVGIGSVLHSELGQVMIEHEPEWAAAIVVDVNTGDLLAAGALPDFDPNYLTDSPADGLPLFWPIEPGSTCKPFVVGAALATGAIKPSDVFDGEGGVWHVRKPPIRNSRGVPGGLLDAEGVLIWSSNIGAGKIGMRLGAESLNDALAEFGFWDATNIRHPEPLLGRRPSPREWENRAWTVPSVSMGHQLSLTPIRLVYAYAALVNGGVLYRPQISLDEEPVQERRVIPNRWSGWMREVLAGVVEMPHRKWLPRWDDLRWGGKSGTVKKLHEDGYTSLFAAFGPVENPQVAVLVVVENPSGKETFGSRVAGPAAGRILRYALGHPLESSSVSFLEREFLSAMFLGE